MKDNFDFCNKPSFNLVKMLSLKTFLIIAATVALSHGLNGNFNCEKVVIIKREEWGSTTGPRQHTMPEKPKRVFVHHTNTELCYTRQKCEEVMKEQEKYYTNVLGDNDVNVQFYIGGDGQVYEGLGWDAVGDHTQRYPNDFGVAFIGEFMETPAPENMMTAFKHLVLCGVSHGAIAEDHSIYGHSDARCTTPCPGAFLLAQLSEINRYDRDPIYCGPIDFH